LSISNPTPAVSTATGIALALRRFPKLCTNGIYLYPGTAPRPIKPDQVQAAIAFLSMLTPTKTPRIGSGSLKHHAENWGRRHGLCSYISRGALTAAAVGLGLVVETYPPSFDMNPHVAIGVSIKDLRRINTAQQKRTAK
jgi:hypothetical protein